MKRIVVLAASVLLSTLVFANGTGDASNASSVVVLNSNGSNLFKVLYKGQHRTDVRVTIMDEKSNVVLTEMIRRKDGFIRPYNFDGLPEGKYTIQIQDEFGIQVEKVNYGSPSPLTYIHLAKLSGGDDKYMINGLSPREEEIKVSIFDSNQELVFQEDRTVSGQFGEVLNLKNLHGKLRIEVGNSHGILKSLYR